MFTTLNPCRQPRNHADYLKAIFIAKFYILYFAFHYPSPTDANIRQEQILFSKPHTCINRWKWRKGIYTINNLHPFPAVNENAHFHFASCLSLKAICSLCTQLNSKIVKVFCRQPPVKHSENHKEGVSSIFG